jgi:streptomycin 6-kinase
MIGVGLTLMGGRGTMTDISDLDERVRQAAEAWGLVVGDALVGGTMSAVFAATDMAGRDLVLKLPAARDNAHDLTGAEAAALSFWAPTGASVSLVDATPDALLLARARPGTPWPWSPPGSLDDLVGVAADLLTRLWAEPSGAYPFPTLEDVYPQDERVARQDAAWEQRRRGEPERGASGLQRLPLAAESAGQLIASCAEEKLLHGDFITKNLVSDTSSRAGWVALDPLPMTGDPAAEVAAFAAYHPAELILPIAEALAQALGLDPRRAQRWAAIWTVHQVAQAWRDDQQHLEQLVASAALNDLLTT